MSKSKQKQMRDILLEEFGRKSRLGIEQISLAKSILLTETNKTPELESGDKQLFIKKERTRRPRAYVGEFITFDYRAKYPKGTKNHPYYDQFPFVCVLKSPYEPSSITNQYGRFGSKSNNEGFLGSNVHYISNFGARSLRVNTLKQAVSTGSLMIFENTVHHYLYDYIAGPITAIPIDEVVSYGSLPLEQFVISDTEQPINKTFIWSQRTNWITSIQIKR